MLHPFLRPILALLASSILASADEPTFKVEIDITAAPECEAFAAKSKTLVEEWYPKINEILFGKDHALPKDTVRLKFEPMKGVAYTLGDTIHISTDWVTKQAPNDYGMVIHELTHVVQNYQRGEGWVTEGIADYIRDKYYEPGVRKQPIDEKNNYRQGYGVAGTFFMWLEENKDPQLVSKLNAALHDRKYSPQIFEDTCGANVDDLWKQFVEARTKK